MTIVETRSITGGVDTHLDVHVAAALDGNGGVLGVESFRDDDSRVRRAARLAVLLRLVGACRCRGHRRLRGGTVPLPAWCRGGGDRG